MDGMADCLEKHKFSLNIINKMCSEDLLSERSFSWIKNDHRQCRWLTRYFLSLNKINNVSSDVFDQFSPKSFVVALVDNLNLSYILKSDAVMRAESLWNSHLEKDRYWDWLIGKHEAEASRFAWNWLKSNHGNWVGLTSPAKCRSDFLYLFDELVIGEDSFELMISKLKKAWSQKKYRDGLNGKKQYNFVLSDKVVGMLDSLSEKYDLSRAEVIETLIRGEELQEIYIRERLTRREAILVKPID